MKKKTVLRGGQKITEVRSDGGKLFFIKTRAGYEFKCPNTKQICILTYDEMFSDCMECMGLDLKRKMLEDLRNENRA